MNAWRFGYCARVCFRVSILFLNESLVRNSFVTARHVCFFHVDHSTPPKNGGKLSSKQIALITVSVVVGCMSALVAVYLLRYEGIFVNVLLVVKSGFLITNARISAFKSGSIQFIFSGPHLASIFNSEAREV